MRKRLHCYRFLSRGLNQIPGAVKGHCHSCGKGESRLSTVQPYRADWADIVRLTCFLSMQNWAANFAAPARLVWYFCGDWQEQVSSKMEDAFRWIPRKIGHRKSRLYPVPKAALICFSKLNSIVPKSAGSSVNINKYKLNHSILIKQYRRRSIWFFSNWPTQYQNFWDASLGGWDIWINTRSLFWKCQTISTFRPEISPLFIGDEYVLRLWWSYDGRETRLILICDCIDRTRLNWIYESIGLNQTCARSNNWTHLQDMVSSYQDVCFNHMFSLFGASEYWISYLSTAWGPSTRRKFDHRHRTHLSRLYGSF